MYIYIYIYIYDHLTASSILVKRVHSTSYEHRLTIPTQSARIYATSSVMPNVTRIKKAKIKANLSANNNRNFNTLSAFGPVESYKSTGTHNKVKHLESHFIAHTN